MDVGPQFSQLQLGGLEGEQAQPSAPVASPARSSSPAPGRRGEQLKMFMTPAEIHEKYQPLDADRSESETYRAYSGSGTYQQGMGTGQSRGYGWHSSTDEPGNWYQRTTGGSKSMGRPETDEELYGRKLNEAQGYGDEEEGYEPKMVGGKSSRWSGETYHPASGSRSSWESPMRYTPSEEGMTLHESIGEEGVHSPIRLGQTIGRMGKPEIVGGHHRLASATEHASYGGWGHQFVPVLHHTDIYEAKGNKSYKYT